MGDQCFPTYHVGITSPTCMLVGMVETSCVTACSRTVDPFKNGYAWSQFFPMTQVPSFSTMYMRQPMTILKNVMNEKGITRVRQHTCTVSKSLSWDHLKQTQQLMGPRWFVATRGNSNLQANHAATWHMCPVHDKYACTTQT